VKAYIIPQEITEKILDYLALKIDGFKTESSAKKIWFKCPKCRINRRCYLMPDMSNSITCISCGFTTKTILDVVRLLEDDKREYSDKDIIKYLIELFNLKVISEDTVNEHFDFYIKHGFDLVPIVRNDKRPIEKEWQNKEHKDKDEWKTWLEQGLNIGIKTGIRSKITVIDIDIKPAPEELKKYFVDAIVQETQNGYHLIYLYSSDLPKTAFNYKEGHVDIENNGGQVVVFPSIANNCRRTFEDISKELKPIPEDFKKFLLENTKNRTLTSFGNGIKENIVVGENELGVVKEGGRNNTLIHIGGVLRKKLNLTDTSYVLNFINKNFCKPSLDKKDLGNIIGQLDKYVSLDEQGLAQRIIDYLKIAEEANTTDLKEITGESKENVKKACSYLINEGFIIKKRTYYHIIKKIEWKDTFMDDGKPIDYEMPYFEDLMQFREGDITVIGAKSKVGKTHIALNIIKRLIKQGKKPYYINLESGNRFSIISRSLCLAEKEFWNATHFSPEEIDIEKNSITIIDWLLPKDYSETDKLFQNFTKQLLKNGGNLIIFVQLKTNGEFFAENMIAMFPAFVCRYFYCLGENKVEDPTKGYFQVDYIREAKGSFKQGKIPCRYDWSSKELIMEEEELKEVEPINNGMLI